MTDQDSLDPQCNIVDIISKCLDQGKYQEALSLPDDEKYSASFKNNCWDLISVALKKIHDDTLLLKPSLYNAVEELLLVIINKNTPEESLLEFIEQIETAKNEAQLYIILSHLQKLLQQITIKRGRSLEWCLSSICIYIEGIPTPELYKLEGRERLLADCERNLRRIVKVYSMLPPFYSPFIPELSELDPKSRIKQSAGAFLISLMGKPLIYIDLDNEINKDSEARETVCTMIQDLCKLEHNLFKFLPYVEKCYKEHLKNKGKIIRYDNDSEIEPYDHNEKLNMTTLSGLFYIVLSQHFTIPDTAIPQVYSSEYVFNTALLCVIHLLPLPDYGPQTKATVLGKALLNRFPNNAPHVLLQAGVHYEFIKTLMNIAIYADFEDVRKDVINLIGGLINKFEYKGRCILIKYILDTSNHSGMMGYIIVVFKNAINEAFKLPELPECFTGLQFFNMVQKILYLPNGAESDLVEIGDQIITALNFLRFIALKDKTNRTGIKDFFTVIETDYLDKLRIGLNMSKAHYEEKLRVIENSQKNKNEEVGPSISINVGGNVLDEMPVDTKKELIQSALNCFHLIEGLVARLSECISINRMQGLNMYTD